VWVTNEAIANAIVDVMGKVPGVADLGLFRSLGQPSIKITPRRSECARYGLNTRDVDSVIQAAIGGQAVTEVYEGERFFDLTVRWKPQYRMSLEAIREITVRALSRPRLPSRRLFFDMRRSIFSGPRNRSAFRRPSKARVHPRQA